MEAYSKRKGFMHALEGIIAAIVLLFYFSSTTLPPLQNNAWTYNSFKQAGTEYINSIERSDTSELFSGNTRIFSEITNSLFESSDISIVEKGVPPKDIKIGILGNSVSEYVIINGSYASPPVCIFNSGRKWYTDEFGTAGCIINGSASNAFGRDVVLVDNTSDGIDKYDAVYIDLSGNNKNDPPFEGPFFTGNSVTIGANMYIIRSIDSNKKSVKFIRVPAYLKNQNITINGRSTQLLYYNATLSDDISQFDILLITDQIDFTSSFNRTKLKNFLLSGKGIVEIINMTDSSYNFAQQEIFGLENTSYGVTGTGNVIYLSENVRSISEPIKIKDYFLGIPLRVNTFVPNSPPYDVSGLPDPGSVHTGFINLTSGSTGIAIAKNGGIVYDSVYVDSNGDYNFSNPSEDAIPHFVEDPFITPSGNYTIKSLDPDGNYVEIRPTKNTHLTNIFNPLNIAPNDDSCNAAEQENIYNISSNDLDASFNISLSPGPLGDSSTLLAGDHTYATITQANSNISGASYNIAVTNFSGELFFNIDLDNNLKYNNAGEGPFSNGDFVRIGPEEYSLGIAQDLSSVNLKLYSRDNVSAAIVSKKYTGRTFWMSDMTGSGGDSWNYVASALLWAAPKNENIYKLLGYQNIVSSKKVFISGEDIFQPYIIEFSRLYR